MLQVHAVAGCPCQCCMSMSMLYRNINAACPCRYYMCMSALHVHVRPHVHDHPACSCCKSMSTLSVHVHAACLGQSCLTMSMLHLHVYAALPCPCCIFMLMLHVHVSILHVYVRTACPSPCYMSIRSRQKKTWPVGKENDFFSHKNNSNVTRNLCISILMISTCCSLIFFCFRQSHRHRFFFSLLVVFAIHIGNPEIHQCRNSLCTGQTTV